MTVIEPETIRLFLKKVTKERSSRDQIPVRSEGRLAGPEVEAGRHLGLRLQRGRHRVHERNEVEEREADHQHVDHDPPGPLAERAGIAVVVPTAASPSSASSRTAATGGAATSSLSAISTRSPPSRRGGAGQG